MKGLKKIGKAFVVAFSLYSKIPMPRFNWESEDMKYHLCFFPWVGAVIGALEVLWYQFCAGRLIGTLPFVMVALAIPILITGGFHLDGFMDTCDALHSYQDREKKLEILKDPHIGAFAVICLAAYLLLAAGAVGIIYEMSLQRVFSIAENRIMFVRAIVPVGLSFFLSRALSGISVVTLPGAKKKGMLQTESDTAGKKTVLIFLVLQVLAVAVGLLVLNPILGALILLAAAVSYGYYWYMSKKEFGGITGDLAGYFVCLSELLILITVAGYLLV